MKTPIPPATVSRLPVYLRCLSDIPSGRSTVSSDRLAQLAGVNSPQVRKDLSYLGSHGVRGVGYVVEELRAQIRQALGLGHQWAVAIIGAGNLGTALANYGGFLEAGFRIVGIFDTDPSRTGQIVEGLSIEPLTDLEVAVAERAVSIGIIATPAAAAQDVANRLAAAGVHSILNFAPTVLNPIPDVEIRRVDLSTELQILSYYLQSVGTATIA